MERLTHKARYEAGYELNKGVKDWQAADRLGAYENTGLTPEQIRKPLIAVEDVIKIIRAHISLENDPETTRLSQDNAGWIPVEQRLPEISRTPEEDDECPEFNVTIRGAEEATTLKYSPADSTWFDDNGYVYDVIAWRPLPEPYRPERSET